MTCGCVSTVSYGISTSSQVSAISVTPKSYDTTEHKLKVSDTSHDGHLSPDRYPDSYRIDTTQMKNQTFRNARNRPARERTVLS